MLDKNFEVDQKAKDFFKSNMPPSWLVRKQDPDHYIDYFIELTENLDPTGIFFAVQLKGTAKLKVKKSIFSFVMETKYLKYYTDKIKQPVFLVVIDTENESGYWLFIQKYIKDNVNEKLLSVQKSLTIKMDQENDLRETEKLKNEILAADLYMRELWPSSVHAAIRAQEKDWQNLDPRMGFSILHEKGDTKIKIFPKENVKFKLHIKEDQAEEFNRKVNQSIEYGLEGNFDAQNVEIEGSALINKIQTESKQGLINFSLAPSIEVILALYTTDTDNKLKTLISPVTGKIHFGTKETRFESQGETSPIEITFKMPTRAGIEQSTVDFEFGFNLTCWYNKPIVLLPFFRKLYAFIKDLSQDDNLNVTVEYLGNPLYTAEKLKMNQPAIFNEWCKHLDLINKVYEISEKLNTNILYPKDGKVLQKDIEQIQMVHDIIFKGSFETIDNGSKLSVTISPNEHKAFKIKNKNKQAVKFVGNKPIMIFNQPIDVGHLEYNFNGATLMTSFSETEIKEAIKKKLPLVLEFKGIKGERLVIRKVNQPNFNK